MILSEHFLVGYHQVRVAWSFADERNGTVFVDGEAAGRVYRQETNGTYAWRIIGHHAHAGFLRKRTAVMTIVDAHLAPTTP